MSKYAGNGWIAEHDYGKAMSPLGIAVADLLGDVFEGIYHLRPNALAKVQWNNPHGIAIVIPDTKGFSTVDHNLLTRLVTLAHDRAMRLAIEGVAPGYLRLIFHQRTREGDLYHSCPPLEEHVALIRKRFGLPNPPAINWIPVGEQMPDPGKPVLVVEESHSTQYGIWGRAVWMPKFHKKDYCDFEGDLEFDEDGEGYWPEGWYEWNNHEETHWGMGSGVTHWAEVELPPLEPQP